MVTVTIGARVDDKVRALLTELTAKDGTNINQLLGEFVNNYLDEHDKRRKQAQTAIEKIDEKVKEAVCPLCDAPLEYSRGWFDDGIRCSNSACDTRRERKFSLKTELGERNYIRLLNLRRRAFTERALKEQEKKEQYPFL